MNGYNLNDYEEFKKYAILHIGVSSMQLHYWEKLQDNIYNNIVVGNSLTPVIPEERKLNVSLMDIFSRLMMDRIIWIAGVVNDNMSTVVQAQLMYLNSIDPNRTITLHIDSPGGSVKSGLSMIDVINYISCDVQTINTGLSASMGAVLLGSGTKGKRFSLQNSKIMLHQVSGGYHGNISDARISFNEMEEYNKTLFNLLASYCDKSPEEIIKDCDRDFWMKPEEAVEYGLIDGIIKKDK